MLTLVFDDLRLRADVSAHAKEIAVRQIDEAAIRSAEPRRRPDDLVENRLEPHPRRAQGPQDVGHGLLTTVQVVQFPNQLGDPVFGRDAIRHDAALPSLTRRLVARPLESTPGPVGPGVVGSI